MTFFFSSLFGIGVFLEVILLWRLHRSRMGRCYPFFSLYLWFAFIRTLVLFGVMKLFPTLYPSLYWGSELIAVMLWFSVTWEVFRHTFPKTVPVRSVVALGMIAMLATLSIIFWTTALKPSAPYGPLSFYPDLERKLALAQAALLVLVLVGARYYCVPLGRNIWGMAVGFGMFVSVSIANFAALQLLESFVPYWQALRPLSFVVMLSVWTWALWSFAPNPELAAGSPQGAEVPHAQWRHTWSQLLTTARKVLEP